MSGKLRAQRAKSMKFKDGYMLKTGDITNYYVDKATAHVKLRSGVLGVKVSIQLPHDPTGREGLAKLLPDVVVVHDPKEVAVPTVAAN